MNKSAFAFAAIIALVVVFALAFPLDTAVAQSDAQPNGDEEYKDGTHDGKSCPNKDRESKSSLEQSS